MDMNGNQDVRSYDATSNMQANVQTSTQAIAQSNTQRICKKCLLRDMAEADKGMIEKYLAAIKQQDRVSAEEYERRLAICKECDRLNSGTCAACGCYVELRAAGTVGHCPYKKW